MPTLSEGTVKIQFAAPTRHPSLITRAAKARGMDSMTEWLQRVVVEALARDLDISLEELLAELPQPRVLSQFQRAAAEK